jgi:hypothetical protein
MRVNKGLVAAALGSVLLIGTAGYAAPERYDRGAEREEQAARAEIRRGETLEQEGRRLERMGDWRRGEMLEQRGESMERHGRQMLRQSEWREHGGEGWERRDWR